MSEKPYSVSLERFKKWLAKQSPKATYRYEDAIGCPLQRFITEVVKPRKPKDWQSDWPFVIVSPSMVFLGDDDGRPLDPKVNAVLRNGAHTYGHLLERVKALRRRK